MTNAADFARLRQLFDTAIDLSAEQRVVFLAGLSGRDGELRSMLEQMLAADTRDDQFLEPPLRTTTAPSLVGRRVGSYHVLRALGEGGMGSVWEAEQDEPRRKVALKTMRVGLSSPHARRRFRFEAELLAGLRHPAIAQVYDAGVLAGEGGAPSLPWFALEFVAGARPLIRYADEEQLTWPARLRLFQVVCSAVHHAHQRGVIHRDLKAANVLVDHEGHLKVIDFGVARSLEVVETASRTLAGEVLGTLASMSPEQVQGRADEIDARSDVYALGVLLHELLTGQRPYQVQGLGLAETVRLICEVEPPPLSRVKPGLPRDLDWLVARAMAKLPARRYGSADELRQEVARVLAHEPLLAGPPSGLYRLSKFYRRHRLAVVASALGLLALTLGGGGLLYGAWQDQLRRGAEQSAQAERDLAARFTANYVDLLERMLPDQADGRLLTYTEFLARAATWVRDDLRDRPLLQSMLLRSVGQVHSGRGEYPQAIELLGQAVSLARAAGESGARELIESLMRLGMAQRLVGDTVAAESALREALQREQAAVSAGSLKLGPLLNELAVLLAPQRPEEARALYQQALDLELARGGELNGDAAVLLTNIAGLDERAGRHEQAREALERALPVMAAVHGAGDPRYAVAVGRLAVVYRGLGAWRRAVALHEQDITLSTEAHHEGHPEVALARYELARTLSARGELAAALTQLDLAVPVLRAAVRPEHRYRQQAECLYGHLLAFGERWAEARAHLAPLAEGAADAVVGLRARVWLAEVERAQNHPTRALTLADAVIAAPPAAEQPALLAEAHWARAYAQQALGAAAAATLARQSALALRAQAAYAEAKFLLLSGDPDAALTCLLRGVAQRDLDVATLWDPVMQPLRERVAFAPVAAALQEYCAR